MTEATAKAEQTAVGPLAAALGRDILSALVGQVKSQPDHWHKMNEITQRKQIDNMREAVRRIVHHAVRSLVSGATYKAIPCKLDGLTFKEGIKGTFALESGADGRHELADSIGQRALIVLADADAYMDRMEDIKETADQMDLFGGDYDPTDDQPAYRRDEKEDRLTPARQGLMSWADLKAKMNEGLITRKEAEEKYGGPIPDTAPRSEDEVPDPLDVLDNIVGPTKVALADLPQNIIITTSEEAASPGLPDPILVFEGETLRRAIERLVPGAKFDVGDPVPLIFGTAAELEAAKNDERAAVALILERLFACGYSLSLGALEALEPEQRAQLKAWSDAVANTPEGSPVPDAPEWLPRPAQPGQNQPDNKQE
jgi:hypothetical protein